MKAASHLVPPGGDALRTSDKTAASSKPCAVCGKPGVVAYKPFCSKRCADVDLARWIKGTYAIPGKGAAQEDDDAAD